MPQQTRNGKPYDGLDPEAGIIRVKGGMELFRSPVIKRPRGQQPKYDPDLADEILHRLSNGASLLDTVEDLNVDFSTVVSWSIDNDYGFGHRYARARLLGCYHLNEQCLRIADDSRNDWMESNDPENPGWKFNGDHVSRVKLRLEQRRFFMAKIAPKVFGDKLDLTLKPEPTTPPIDISQLTPAQMTALEQVAKICAEAGIKIRIESIGPEPQTGSIWTPATPAPPTGQ